MSAIEPTPMPAEETTDIPVGEILRRARTQYNLSLPEVEYQLRIRAFHLDALEKNDAKRLPGRVYAIGFVRAYSEYLGLDGDKMVALFKKQSGPHVHIKKADLSFPTPADDSRVPGLPVVAGSIAFLLLLMMVWGMVNPQSVPANQSVPAIPKDLEQQLTVPEKPDPAVAAVATAAPVVKPHPLVLKAEQNVWLEIRGADGKAIFSRVLKEGEEYWVPEGLTGLKMTTGNAGGLQIIVNGQALAKLGKVGDVRRNVSLDFPGLKAAPAPVSATIPAAPVAPVTPAVAQ